MAIKTSKAELSIFDVDDRSGGLAERLEPLAKAGANLEMVFARRTPENPGRAVMFATPIKGAKATKAAQDLAGGMPRTIPAVRVEGSDKPGLGAKIARALGEAGVSVRAVNAIALGSKFVSFIACDSVEDQARVIAALKKAKL